MIDFIRVVPENQLVKQRVLERIAHFIDGGDYIDGEPVREFERQFAHYVGCRYAVGVNSGTDALILAMKALGIGSGDEVITVSLTFPATIMAILQCGAVPVLIDVNEHLTMDPDRIEACITPRTKAIMPVHYTGKLADMRAICRIARQYGLFVVEDAAQAAGAHLEGRPAGSWGDVGCFSFFPTKNLSTIGDGGMVVCNRKRLADRVRLLRNFGRSDRETFKIPGINSRLDTIHAIVLMEKLRFADDWNRKRIAIADRYRAALQNVLAMPVTRPDEREVFHFFIGRLRQGRNGTVIRKALEQGVDLRVHYVRPVHRQPFWKRGEGRVSDLRMTEKLARIMLTLPCYPSLTEREQQRVIDFLQKGEWRNESSRGKV